MFNLASEKTFQDGQTIFLQGDSGNQIYVILSGSVEISKMGKGERFVINTLKPGEVFGELSFFGGFTRTATATASGETRLGRVDLLHAESELGRLSNDVRVLLGIMLQRYKSMVDRASEFSYRTSPRVERSVLLTYPDNESFIKASMIKASTGNLSVGGLFIRTENPYDKGERFSLDLQLPDIPETLTAACEVAWSRKRYDADDPPRGWACGFWRCPTGIGIC